jgi:hypothetical protein
MRTSLKTSPELAAWIEKHGVGGRGPERIVPDAPQPLLIEREPAEGHAPPKPRRPAKPRRG